jgi:hypothetical protein
MNRISVGIVLLAVPLATMAKAPTLVLLNGAWTGSMAVEWCRPEMRDACRTDALDRARAFELKLKTQFAAVDACKGVQLGDYVEYLNDPHRDRDQDYWYMSVDFTPYGLVWQGRAWGPLDADKGQKQKWTIFLESDKKRNFAGEGTPTGIAHDVCTIVLGAGGNVFK